jgi:cell division protein FtsI/penicillin-binding protein 2
MPQVPDGASLILSIDREVQRAMEETIDDGVAESGSDLHGSGGRPVRGSAGAGDYPAWT